MGLNFLQTEGWGRRVKKGRKGRKAREEGAQEKKGSFFSSKKRMKSNKKVQLLQKVGNRVFSITERK